MARRGDTKPLCQRAQAGVAFLGVSLLPISDGKPLVLCQAQWTTSESDTQVGQTPGRLTLASRGDVGQAPTVLETPVA
jgi:hypothetical protein